MYASSTVAHTSFICEGKEYLIPSYNDWTTMDEVTENENYVSLEMSHHLLDGIELKRKFIWIKPNIVILIDEAYSRTIEKFTQNFIMENYPMKKVDERRVVVQIAPGFDVSITQCLPNFLLNEYHGTNHVDDEQHIRGSLIQNEKMVRRGLNLAYTQEGNIVKFFTLIECHNSSQKEVQEKKVKKLHRDENEKLVIEFFESPDIVKEV